MHESCAIKIREDIPLDRACFVGCGTMTGVGAAINTANVQPGSSTVVIGCGGVGLNVIQGCALAGARQVIAVDLLDSKLEFAKTFLCLWCHPYHQPRPGRRLQGGDGTDRRPRGRLCL